MVVIRLSRSGNKNRPYFNVVVADSKKPRDGRFIERIGFYNPMARTGSETLRLETDRIEYWQAHGALLSETMTRIVKLHAKGPDGLAEMKEKDAKKAASKKAKKEAEGVKVAAEAEAYSIEIKAAADAKQTSLLAKAIKENGKPAVDFEIAKRQVEAIGQLSASQNAKTLILPSDISSIFSAVTALAEMLPTEKK